ncbi:MAG: hypothetical protein KBT50_02475 [Cycloclasticus sp.]|nr:hypothetical protein [Cycloclasticus sp.]
MVITISVVSQATQLETLWLSESIKELSEVSMGMSIGSGCVVVSLA